MRIREIKVMMRKARDTDGKQDDNNIDNGNNTNKIIATLQKYHLQQQGKIIALRPILPQGIAQVGVRWACVRTG